MSNISKRRRRFTNILLRGHPCANTSCSSCVRIVLHTAFETMLYLLFTLAVQGHKSLYVVLMQSSWLFRRSPFRPDPAFILALDVVCTSIEHGSKFSRQASTRTVLPSTFWMR